MFCVSRRRFLAEAAVFIPLVSACAGVVDAPEATAPLGVELTSSTLLIRLARVPSLATVGGSLVVGEANVIVLRTASIEYRAFSNICTHAGCGIHQFVASRLRCQCHGSEFDVDGINVAGPAPSPLTRLATRLEGDGTLLHVTRA